LEALHGRLAILYAAVEPRVVDARRFEFRADDRQEFHEGREHDRLAAFLPEFVEAVEKNVQLARRCVREGGVDEPRMGRGLPQTRQRFEDVKRARAVRAFADALRGVARGFEDLRVNRGLLGRQRARDGLLDALGQIGVTASFVRRRTSGRIRAPRRRACRLRGRVCRRSLRVQEPGGEPE
jgi:hypothetical protein